MKQRRAPSADDKKLEEDVEQGSSLRVVVPQRSLPLAEGAPPSAPPSPLRQPSTSPQNRRRFPVRNIHQAPSPHHYQGKGNNVSSSPRMAGMKRISTPQHMLMPPRPQHRQPDPFFRRLMWAFFLLCPFSFALSLFLSAYLLEQVQELEKTHPDGVIDPNLLTQQFQQWLPQKVHGMVPSLWWVDEIDMRELTYTLPFDNPAGGVWTQGWELEPLPTGRGHDTLQVFVVPHSHCDPGWLKTFDQYFDAQTKQIIDTVVKALSADPRRKFIWAEISYMERWWQTATADQRQALRQLLDKGQLEFVTGSWVMPDEANSQIYALEMQMQEGHDWIRETLGPQHVPRYAWSIDPFGYSPTMAYLLAKHNFTGMVIQRVHYAVKKELAKRQHLEFSWRQTWDNQGEYDIWTHVLPFFSYDVSHSCGPDPSVCCQFDFARRPVGQGAKACPWKKNPQRIDNDNVAERAALLLDQYRKKASLYRTRTVLVPLGDDFRFQTHVEAEAQYSNYQRLFDYMNHNIPGVHVQFGTLKDYFQAAAQAKVDLPLLKGSFFTYSDVGEDYWSGYFTSRAFDKALDRQLERSLYTAERLGADKVELREARRALSLFQHHDGVTGTATTRVVHDYAYRMKNAIELAQQISVKYLKEEFSDVLKDQFPSEEVLPCLVAGSPRGIAQNLCNDDGVVALYNPLNTEQRCGNKVVPPNQVVVGKLPCDIPGPSSWSMSKLEVDATTGLLLDPFREEWMGWHVKKGGAYLFYPGQLFRFDRENSLVHTKGSYTVSGPGWNRTVVEQHVPAAYAGKVTVVDFIYETDLQRDNEEWFVRFSSNIANNGYFYTDLNGFNFDTHRFRRDLPIQSQVFPMPTHAAIQDEHYRLTVLSEHSQGTASLEDGSIDIWLDRRLAQDDGKGLGQGVQDNAPTKTRLRVILEKGGFEHDNQNFQVTDLVRSYWEQLQHPLEKFGPHRKQLDNALVVVDPAKVEQERDDRRNKRAQLRDGAVPDPNQVGYKFAKDAFMDDKLKGRLPVRNGSGQLHEEKPNDMTPKEIADEHGDVPFVFMVYNRLHYLNQSIESLRNSDFPRERVPIIISHDGHVPEIVDFVETIKKDFNVIQLFHPFSCHEHPNSFPMDDAKLNEGYQGDKAKNPREGKITCAKHHFTWMLNQVFSRTITTTKGQVNYFAFLEEDYIVGPAIYEAIIYGLHVADQAEQKVPGGVLGLELDPTFAGNRKEQTQLGEKWFSLQWATGPMTLGRNIFDKMKENAEIYCSFDDYNWDWSMVKLANEDKIPYVVLAPARMLAKHIGVEGMHTEQLKKIKKKQDSINLVPWVGRSFLFKRIPKKKAPGYGGWGHPADHEHCRNLFSGTGNLTRLYEYWDRYKLANPTSNHTG